MTKSYISFRDEKDLKITLSKEEKEFIFSIFPKGKIIESIYFDNFNLPCPLTLI